MAAFARIREDIDAIMARDPAARSATMVALCYPGFHAVLIHRFAHWLWKREMFVLGRLVSHTGRFLTGIEIHPGAVVGRRVFIDHGMGCVIGETAEVGDDVTLYHDVTLGGVSLDQGKRHPTLEDGVIVGAGAQILGPVTVGKGARIGANAVALADVPPGVTMVGIPARQILPRQRGAEEGEFMAYGTPFGDLPDPAAKALKAMLTEIEALRARIETLEQSDNAASAPSSETTAETDAGTSPPQ